LASAAYTKSPEAMSVPLSLDEEARLYTTNAEREKYESLATLYGIVVALDYLERAYVRDSVTAAEGTPRHALDCCHNIRPCLSWSATMCQASINS